MEIYCCIINDNIFKAKKLFYENFSHVIDKEEFKQTNFMFFNLFNIENSNLVINYFYENLKKVYLEFAKQISYKMFEVQGKFSILICKYNFFDKFLTRENYTFPVLEIEKIMENCLYEIEVNFINKQIRANSLNRKFENESFISDDLYEFNNSEVTDFLFNSSKDMSKYSKDFSKDPSSIFYESSQQTISSYIPDNNKINLIKEINLKYNLIVKRENLNKKILRGFKKFLKNLLEHKFIFKSTSGNRLYYSCFDDIKDLENSNLLFDFVFNKLTPPCKYQNFNFKTYNHYYLSFLFYDKLFYDFYVGYITSKIEEIQYELNEEYKFKDDELEKIILYIKDLPEIYNSEYSLTRHHYCPISHFFNLEVILTKIKVKELSCLNETTEYEEISKIAYNEKKKENRLYLDLLISDKSNSICDDSSSANTIKYLLNKNSSEIDVGLEENNDINFLC